MGEVTREETYRPAAGQIAALPAGVREVAEARLATAEGRSRRHLVRTGNFHLTRTHFQWVSDLEVAGDARPPWAVVVERLEWGVFYGTPQGLARIEPMTSGETVDDLLERLEPEARSAGATLRIVVRGADGSPTLLPAEAGPPAGDILGVALWYAGPRAAWDRFRTLHPAVRERWHRRRRLEKDDIGRVNARQESARLAARAAELRVEAAVARSGPGSEAAARARTAAAAAAVRAETVRAEEAQRFSLLRRRIAAIDADNARYQLVMRTAGEGEQPPRTVFLPLDEIVRAYPANRLGAAGRLRVYLSRWAEFLTDDPREANSEGGVFPAIFGTVVMTLAMSILVVPFGVLAALYLREYARSGLVVSTVRIAVNNLAGVPSIVFGVFGLGFFCYVIGASIDQLLFVARLPDPTFGKGGLLWASLTLALLTLPVVIVSTEEALAAVPNSMREGSLACGASKWQTIRRIVLPRAAPGIITGMILAVARGAGEVAPLMLVGAVKLAPRLPVDATYPFLHPQRSFMHLGFHIFDVGFQSQNSEAARPMVFTTTLLLLAIVTVLNLAAIWLRSRLRKRFFVAGF
ncbi:MAG: phosphate ABC transporter permease PstA [Acidobacteriota bacterium]